MRASRRMRLTTRLAGLALLALASPCLGQAVDLAPKASPDAVFRPRPRPAAIAADPRVAADLFAMPRIADTTRAALARVEAGDLEGGARMIGALAARHPAVGALQADRATLAMLAGDRNRALEALMAAAAHGFDGLGDLLADPLFAPLAGDPRLATGTRAPTPPPPEPARISGGTALVSAANTAWNPATERLEPRFAFPARAAPRVVPRRRAAAYDILSDRWRAGRAAGNAGDLYDNRDRGHSRLDPDQHPQLAHVVYSDAARAADLDYGLNDRLLFDQVTLGNSSTAVTGGALWRSLPRAALTRADGTGPLRLWQNASRNHLYVYPAHRDYGEEMGDLFPANTPYVLVSRGSSGSDRPFLEAAAMILAAFRPDTKARLASENLVVPTLQMVFRRSLQSVRSRDDYLSGAAHPAAFEAFDINLARMVSLANSIEAGDIPPQVRIRMETEDLGTQGVDYFGAGLSEQLFDTPAAIARIWRSRAWSRSMTLSAEDTRDPNGRPLTFDWSMLQGDPARVRITPLDGGARARITLDWHEPFRISQENPLTSARVDIGVFASNGRHDSAPAILSVYFPPHEARSYAPGPDGAPRITAIDHAARPEVYADPMLVARADWHDDFHYAADGTPTGWTRSRGGAPEAFTASGARIRSPGRAEILAYPLARTPGGGLGVEALPTGEIVDY